MSKDVKLFCACDHFVNDVGYMPDQCPKCYGKGYYYDISFDKFGQAVIAENSIKLQQEMLKIIIDHKYHNEFHLLWGSEIDQVMGSKNVNMTKAKVEFIVRNALQYLKNNQNDFNLQFKTMKDEEILDKILNIVITPLAPTGYDIQVTISNSLGQVLQQSITV